MTGRILCVGGENYLTRPSASGQSYENGRKYEYAPPGKVYHYKAEGVVVIREVGECDPQYGIVIIDDYLITEIKPSIDAPAFGVPHDFIQTHQTGMDRAPDLSWPYIR